MDNNSFKNLKVIALNVNSIIKITRRHNLNNFIKKNHPDFMLISETKLNENHKVSFSNYNVYRNDRLIDSGGGTAIICKNVYKVEQMPHDNNIKSLEYTMVKVFLSNNELFYVISVYRSQTKQLNTCDLEVLISKCGHSKFIIGGDFNSKHRAWLNTYSETNGNMLND